MNKPISWSDFFMGTAALASRRSKDPVCQVGAVVVNDQKHIVGVGYNGFPHGTDDSVSLWGKSEDDPMFDKRTFVVHAEANAILNTSSDPRGCHLYVTRFPCNECAKLIVQSGIRSVTFSEIKNSECWQHKASSLILENAQVALYMHTGELN